MNATIAGSVALIATASVCSGLTLQASDVNDLGGGMYGHTLTALGEDGYEGGFYIDITVECLDPGVDHIHQMKAILEPGVLERDVYWENYAYEYDGQGDPPYDMWRDTWFYEAFGNSVALQVMDTCLVRLKSGTKPLYPYMDADVAYISLTGRARVHGQVYRLGEWHPFDFIIPEPAAAALLALGFLAVRRRRHRRA